MLEIKNVKGGFELNGTLYKWKREYNSQITDNNEDNLQQLESYVDDFVREFAEECYQYFEDNYRVKDNMIELGEYFFNEVYELDFSVWEDLESNLQYEVMSVNDDFDKIDLYQWSSKSGTSVFVKVDLNQFEYELEDFYLKLCSGCKKTQFRYLKEFIDSQNKLLNRLESMKVKLCDDLEKAEAKVRPFAEGVRCGCFSNGEVIFSRLDNDGNVRKGGMLTGHYDEEMGVA